MSAEYAAEKLTTAVRYMALGLGSIQQRLAAAGQEFIVAREEDFPESLRPEYRSLRDRLSHKPGPGGTGGIAATTQAMTDTQAMQAGGAIFDLLAKVEGYIADGGK